MKIRRLNESVNMENSEALAKVADKIESAKKEYEDLLSESKHCILVIKGIEELFTGKSENGNNYFGRLKRSIEDFKDFLEESDFAWGEDNNYISGHIKFNKIGVRIRISYNKDDEKVIILIDSNLEEN